MNLSNVSDRDLIKEIIQRGYKVVPNNVWDFLVNTVPMTAKSCERKINSLTLNQFDANDDTINERLMRIKAGEAFKLSAGIFKTGERNE